METIRTERLLLRPARMADAEPMHDVLSDPSAMRYWSTLPHASLEESREWIRSMMADGRGERDFIIELDGAVIGKAGCYRLPEIGYILHPDHWGQGFAAEAMTAVIERIFERFELPSLRADTDPRNGASIRLLERLGFTRVGQAERTWNIGGAWYDSVYYELRRP